MPSSERERVFRLPPPALRHPMHLGPHRFSDLGTLIESVHEIFARWEAADPARSESDAEALYRAKLATHEWLANLVQHATFNGAPPEICLDLRLNGEAVHCVIEDNSLGFDFHGRLQERGESLEPFPERGMGLLMLDACTDELSYGHVEGNRNRLTFKITTEKDPWLDIPFQ